MGHVCDGAEKNMGWGVPLMVADFSLQVQISSLAFEVWKGDDTTLNI